MKLYEIDQAITNLIDPETGELTDYAAFESLQMEREKKIESLALWIKDLNAEAKAIKEERDTLYERQKAAEKKAASIKSFLEKVLNGEKFKTPRVAVSYRKTNRVQVDAEFLDWARANADDLLTYKDPTPSLTAIKAALDSGRAIAHAELVQSNNITIK